MGHAGHAEGMGKDMMDFDILRYGVYLFLSFTGGGILIYLFFTGLANYESSKRGRK